MKLAKIDENFYLNSDFIESVKADGESSTDITMKNGEVFSPNIPIKKVLDAICGSEEHLWKYELAKTEAIYRRQTFS